MSDSHRKLNKPRGSQVEPIFTWLFRGCAILTLLIMVGIIISLFFGSWQSINHFGLKFIFEKEWNPTKDIYGALPMIVGTLLSSLIALIIAVPISFGIAVFLTELSPKWLKSPLGIAIELLAAIPSIVYGMWGLLVFAPLLSEYVQEPLQNLTENTFLEPFFSGAPVGIGIFSAGIILAIMIIPFISSVIRDVFNLTPTLLKESAYGLGCTTWEVVRRIIFPHSKIGVMGGIILGLGRALGETMAVTFVIGNMSNLSLSIFEPANSITSVLANEFSEATSGLHQSSLMYLGLVLFLITTIVLAISKALLIKVSKQ